MTVVPTEQRQRDAARQRERLYAFLTRSGLERQTVTVVPLTGDASDRRYYRLLRREAPSIVLALHPNAFDHRSMPFVRVASLLREMTLPVPEIIGHEDDLGLLVLQDLGDVTLQAYLGDAPRAQHEGLYRLAISFIEILQRRGADLASPDYPPYGVAFDVEKLTWELEFFRRHFIEGFRGVAIGPAAQEALAAEWRALAEELASEPRVLCHRDYHSRNLMLSGGDLYMIDFQDARMGPDTYDLASLLRDAYVDLPEPTVDELIAYFLALRQSADASRFRQRFDLMALQRMLKALGTFGFQATVRENPVYIQYIPRTLALVRDALGRQNRFGRLGQILGTHIHELR